MNNEDPLEQPKWKDLKDIYLAKKQGEALERITRPTTHYESLGLGYFGPQTVLALGAIDLFEDAINEIVKMGMTEEEQQEFMLRKHYDLLHIFTEEIGVASGSRDAKRMEKGLETIGQLGQYLPFNKHDIPKPTALEAPND